MILLKIGLCGILGVADIIVGTGSRLLVVCGENIDGRGIGNGPWFALYIPHAMDAMGYGGAMGSGQAKTLIICAIMLKTGWI
jgi:hypothetical protein